MLACDSIVAFPDNIHFYALILIFLSFYVILVKTMVMIRKQIVSYLYNILISVPFRYCTCMPFVEHLCYLCFVYVS